MNGEARLIVSAVGATTNEALWFAHEKVAEVTRGSEGWEEHAVSFDAAPADSAYQASLAGPRQRALVVCSITLARAAASSCANPGGTGR